MAWRRANFCGLRQNVVLPCPCAFALLLLCWVYGSCAGQINVDPYGTAVWGKNITLKCLIEVNETITQIAWEKVIGKSAQTIAVHHPIYGTDYQGSYQNRTTFKNTSFHDATIVINNVDFSDAGEYVCKAVTFPLGNVQSSTTVTVLVEPTVSIAMGPDPLIDGANETVAASCTAATGKPAAEVYWEESFGKAERKSTSFSNKTVTVLSQYKLIPTRFARRRNITCVVKHPAWENVIRYPFTLDIQYAPEVSITGYDGNWFVGRKHVQLKCNADANPDPTEIKWIRLDGNWPDGLLSVNNTLHFNYPLTHNVSGIYVCKVTNALGQKSAEKIITILDPPATTPPPTIPQTHSAIDPELATTSRRFHIPASTMASMHDGNFGTIIGSVVGGCLFLILIIVLFGILYHRRKQTFRGDYFTKSYIPPSDMQKESQIDVFQPEDLDPYPQNLKKEVDTKSNDHIYNEYLHDDDNSDWNHISYNRYQEQFDRPVNNYNEKNIPIVSQYNQNFDNEDDLVSHVDGSVISRREWYV